MKKLLGVFVLFCCGFMVYAQDIITLKTGEEIEVEVQEIGVDSIKYKKPGTEGPMYTIRKTEIFMIKYANGEKETFKDEPVQAAANTGISAPPDNFTTGQRWGAWALNNFVLPGLGSYVIMKDWAGGSVILGLGLGGIIVTSVGVSTISTAYKDVEETQGSGRYQYTTVERQIDGEKQLRGIILVGVGSAVLLAEFIYNIVRCASYDKPSPKVTRGFDPARLNIALLPGENGGDKVQLSYTMSF
jgi:hypothetical protein